MPQPSRRGPGTRPGAGPRKGAAPGRTPRSGATPRPAARTRPGATGVVVAQADGRRGSFTGRAALLALVLLVLAVSYAYPLRTWIQQRGQLADLRAEQAQARTSVAELQSQKAQWDDPAYVEALARGRLHFVMPGEVGLTVIPDRSPEAAPPVPDGLVTPATQGQWWERLWGTVEKAGGTAGGTPRAAATTSPTPRPSATP